MEYRYCEGFIARGPKTKTMFALLDALIFLFQEDASKGCSRSIRPNHWIIMDSWLALVTVFYRICTLLNSLFLWLQCFVNSQNGTIIVQLLSNNVFSTTIHWSINFSFHIIREKGKLKFSSICAERKYTLHRTLKAQSVVVHCTSYGPTFTFSP